MPSIVKKLSFSTKGGEERLAVRWQIVKNRTIELAVLTKRACVKT